MSKYLLGRQTFSRFGLQTYRPALRDMLRAESLAANRLLHLNRS